MCQWKFFVLRYKANRSASNTVKAAEMSLLAAAVRFVGVESGANRRVFALRASISRVSIFEFSPRLRLIGIECVVSRAKCSVSWTTWRKQECGTCAMLRLLNGTCRAVTAAGGDATN